MYTTRERYWQRLLQWHGEQRNQAEGISKQDLYDRVTNGLNNPKATDEELLSLVKETRGGSGSTDDNYEWTEAKSPTVWQKEFGISGTTWRRWERDRKIVVDRSISNKMVRIRMDTYRAIKGSK